MSEPIYSTDPAEESRMLKIRDNAANRVAEMARSRVAAGRQIVLFHDVELTWIGDEDRHYMNPIPMLSPQEYWAMIRCMAGSLRRERDNIRMLKMAVDKAINDRHSPGT